MINRLIGAQIGACKIDQFFLRTTLSRLQESHIRSLHRSQNELFRLKNKAQLGENTSDQLLVLG
ncbi:MAG: hypothetical protein DMG08_16435 [Acidobacteria bacterium]|nr:MAG: hypothetical protein DMG08_16435 [Acidobacteriota bacterium]PYV39141.1 MAG: hypothetical protein DMG09_09935 [Acidobacteriota bacterium]